MFISFNVKIIRHVHSQLTAMPMHGAPFKITPKISLLLGIKKLGHLTGRGGADPHNSLISVSSEHFPHKTEKLASY